MKFILLASGRLNRCKPGVLPLRPYRSSSLSRWLAMCVLFGTLASQAATTHVFENLLTFGKRLPAGDPLLTPANTSDGPKDISVGDLNGDGRPDIAVANKDGSVTVYFCLNGGQFGPPQHLHTGGGELRGIVCADLTGDGIKDIAVGAPYTNVVYLFVNQGAGTFGEAVQLPAWHGARDLAAGDFDGDGLIDLAVGGSTNGVSHWRSLGGGSFEVRTNIVSIGPNTDRDFPQPAFYLKSFRPLGASRDELAAARAQEEKVWVLGLDTNNNLAVQTILTNVSVNAFDTGPVLHPASSPCHYPHLF